MIRRMKRENAMETGFRRCCKGLGIERNVVFWGLSRWRYGLGTTPVYPQVPQEFNVINPKICQIEGEPSGGRFWRAVRSVNPETYTRAGYYSRFGV